ncbi:putative ribonuclease H-like domain-containing protein [Tanacetum coccineum]
MLKFGEYEMWEIRIKQYFQIQDYALWEVIENGNSWVPIPVTATETGLSTGLKMTVLSTAEEKICKKNDVKARSLLHMALPNEHQLTFDQYVDAQSMFAAIKARFGGNEATKKTQKALLKQQYENFNASSSESLDSIFNRLQKLDTHVVVWMNKPDFDTMGLDDLCKHTEISTASFSDATVYAFLSTQPQGSQLVHEDLEQLHDDDLEEMDLKWNMALLSMRARKFYQRTGRKIIIDGSNTVCSSSKAVRIEDAFEKASTCCAIDGAGFDWSDMAEEEIQANMALMAFSDSEVTNDKSCLKNYEALKKQYDDLLVKLDDTGFKASTYKREPEVNEHGPRDSSLKPTTGCDKESDNSKENTNDSLKQQQKTNSKTSSVKVDKDWKEKFFCPANHVREEEPKKVRENNDAPIIEDWVSDDEDEVEPIPKVEKKTVIPTATKKEFVKPEKPVRRSVRYVEMYRSQRPRGNQRNWNGQKSNQLGCNFVFNNKACFICGSFDHIQYSCPKTSHPSAHKHMAPKAVLMKTGLKSFNTARPINTVRSVNTGRPFSTARSFNTVRPSYTAHPKSTVHCARPRTYFQNQAQSTVHRPFYKRTTLTKRSYYQNVNTGRQRFNTGRQNVNTVRARGFNAVKPLCIWNYWKDKQGVSESSTSSQQDQDCIVMPIWKDASYFDSSLEDNGTADQQVNTASLEVNTGSRDVSTAVPKVNNATPEDLVGPSHASKDTQVEDQEIELGNIPQSYAVPTTPHIRIHKDHPIDHVIGDVQSSVQTRRMTSSYSELGFLNAIYEGKTHKDLHTCLFACFLSQEEPKRVSKALSDLAWVEAMQEELLQFKLQKVWILVDLPKGHRAIERRGIDYDEVFAPVARIEAIRIFLAYASYMGFMVYQMDVKSAFLYGQIEEEVYGEFRDEFEKLMRISDIMFAVCACAKVSGNFVSPKTSHLLAVKRIFRYLKGKPSLGLWYPKDSPLELVAYTDSDYAGATQDRKSTTGGCQFLGNRLISWQCKKQTVVATSTTEAEYVAAANCCGQVLWIQNQLLDYGYNFMNTIIYIDNTSTICIIENPVQHSKTKHIEIRHHFIRDCNAKKLIQMAKIDTEHNVADLLTKGFDAGYTMKCEIGFSMVHYLRGGMLFVPKSVGFKPTTNGHSVHQSLIDYQELTSPEQRLLSIVFAIRFLLKAFYDDNGEVPDSATHLMVLSLSITEAFFKTTSSSLDDHDGFTSIPTSEILSNWNSWGYQH